MDTCGVLLYADWRVGMMTCMSRRLRSRATPSCRVRSGLVPTAGIFPFNEIGGSEDEYWRA
jgi:hypothetical protein